MCPMTTVAMVVEGHRCDTCAWTLWLGTDLEQHNFGLVHQTLLDAFARLTPEEFKAFCDTIISNGGTYIEGEQKIQSYIGS